MNYEYPPDSYEWTPDLGDDPLWERRIDEQGRQVSRLRREATQAEIEWFQSLGVDVFRRDNVPV